MRSRGCRLLIGVFFLFPCLFLGISQVNAAGYPDHPITIVVPYAPGGNTDLSARALAEYLEKQLKQPVIVVNKAGGASTVGGYAVASAKPDGYTLGFFPDVTSIPEVFSYFFQAPYSSNDLRPVCRAFFPVLCYFANGDAPWTNLRDFMDYARKNPGVKFGHPGKMTPGYIAMSIMNKTEKTALIDVPFDSDAKVVPAVLGGHVPIGAVGFAGIKSLYDAKKVKLLSFITIPNRAPFAPEVPTLTEMGVKMTCFPYHGLFTQKGVPDEIVKKIDEAVSRVVEDPGFQKVTKAMGTYYSYQDSAGFGKSLAEYKEAYTAFLKDEGMVK